ncbi:MAG: major capsid protein [Panacagrimonas sp.]
MATTRLADIIEPSVFTAYIVQNSLEKTALIQSGAVVPNAAITEQLQAGAESFNVPFWLDIGNEEANVVSDDPASFSTPNKITSGKQVIRRSFLHNSWSAMNFASELSGSDALKRIQDRVLAYWQRQSQRRLVSTLQGILADNVANDASDMVHDITAASGEAAKFSAAAVIDAAGTLGDAMSSLIAVGMHSKIYKRALANDLVQTIPDSQGGFIQTFRGMAMIVDDGMPVVNIEADPEEPEILAYTSVLFGPGAMGYGFSAPRIAEGTEVENLPSAGKGGGQQVLHSRINLALHPLGYQWKEASVAGASPTIAELATATNWDRVVERKAIPLAFLLTL